MLWVNMTGNLSNFNKSFTYKIRKDLLNSLDHTSTSIKAYSCRKRWSDFISELEIYMTVASFPVGPPIFSRFSDKMS
jgi:hypothetical protein